MPSHKEFVATSFAHLQHAEDSSHKRRYIPRRPYLHIDSSGRAPFPSVPALDEDNVAKVFETKFEFDTLFFVFYFRQGTYEQWLAARELRKLSWRFHLQHLLWFQRHEEPSVTTAEYEQGSYVYFEYEYDWCQRIKNDFTFEYVHLEDDRSMGGGQ